MHSFFARRTSWNLTTNRYSEALEAYRKSGRELLDLTASNPTTVGLRYNEEKLLRALTRPEALSYDPQPKGLLAAREAVASYYTQRGSKVAANDLILTTSTSEAYSFVFRLLCDPGDVVLVPAPSYPLFDFLADLQDVKLAPYELVYDHGWQIDFHSLSKAIEQAEREGRRCRAVLVVHPNNPTGSYVKSGEMGELNRICTGKNLAIIADEVFLDYAIVNELPLTFSRNSEVLTFTLSGLSKISGLPQMKVAWLGVSAPKELKAEAMARLEVIADTYLSMNAPVQWAIPELLEERDSVQAQLMSRVHESLATLDSKLATQKLCRRLDVEGGWYAILRVPATASDEQLAIDLLQQAGVLVQPGHFYDFAANGYLVISLIAAPKIFETGIGRILKHIATLGGESSSTI